MPVPQIVLAEDPARPKSFIVIDGKQRLLTLAGYLEPQRISYWKDPVLSGLTTFKELNGASAERLSSFTFGDYHRRLVNADVRCTIISNVQDEDVLYEVFYRINTGFVRLSTQELRQVLKRGWFADFLVDATSTLQPIHEVLGLEEPDVRLADIEIILRSLAIELYGKNYNGNMKAFLDTSMERITKEFERKPDDISAAYEQFNQGIEKLKTIFEPLEIGRKVTNGEFERRFNRALFEVEEYFFCHLSKKSVDKYGAAFREAFISEIQRNATLRTAVESTTKSIERTSARFVEMGKLVEKVFSEEISVPVPH